MISLFFHSSLRITGEEHFREIELSGCEIILNIPDILKTEEIEKNWIKTVYETKNEKQLYLTGGCTPNKRKTNNIADDEEYIILDQNVKARIRYKTWRKSGKIITGATLYFATRNTEYYFALISTDKETDPDLLKDALRKFALRIRFVKPPEIAISEQEYRIRLTVLFSVAVSVLLLILSLLFKKSLQIFFRKNKNVHN